MVLTNRVLILSFWLLVPLQMAISIVANAAELKGKIVGQSDTPKAFARVDIRGPENLTLVADSNGRFRIDLPEGVYSVSISEVRGVL